MARSHAVKVAIIHYSAPPIIGGVERVIRDQAEGLLETGCAVKIVAGRGAQWHPDIPVVAIRELDSLYPEALQLQGRMLDGEDVAGAFEDLADRIRHKLVKAISDVNVAVVHNVMTMHKNMAAVRAIASLASEMRTPAFIIWTHDVAVADPLYRNQIGNGYPWNMLRKPVPRASYVAVSEERRSDLARVTGLKKYDISVIPNGVNVFEVLQIGSATRSLMKRHGLEGRYPLILMPVRITRRKRIELAMQALKLLSAEFPDALLAVTGPSGPHNPASDAYVRYLLSVREELRLQDHVRLLQVDQANGERTGLDQATIYELMKWADAILITSLHEGFGLPALEAVLHRVPIVCTDLEPIRQIAGNYPLYFSAQDTPERIANLLGQLLSSDACLARRNALTTYARDQLIRTKVLPLLTHACEGIA